MAVSTRCLPALLWATLAMGSLACAGATAGPEAGAGGPQTNGKNVIIVYDRWHAGIVLRKADIAPGLLPEIRDFPRAENLEFSWGDKDYFPATEPGLGLALKAAFWSSGSVLHLVGFDGAAQNFYPAAEVAELNVTEQGYERLLQFIAATFLRPEPSVPARAQPGLSTGARFYAAVGKFSILRTCNTWVAEALEAAGLPVSPGYVITAGSLGEQLRPLVVRK